MTPDSQEEPHDLEDVKPADCNRWFYCPRCDQEYRDPHAEIHNDELVGNCRACGDVHTKPLQDAFEGQTTLQRRQEENQQLTEWCA